MPTAKAKPPHGNQYPRNPDGLTERQRRFVQEYLRDPNATQAAALAGYSDPNKGRQLVAKGNVGQAIAAAQARRARKCEVTAEFVLRRLKREALHADNASARVAALRCLGNHLGMKLERGVKVENTVTVNVSELTASERAARVAALMALAEQRLTQQQPLLALPAPRTNGDSP